LTINAVKRVPVVSTGNVFVVEGDILETECDVLLHQTNCRTNSAKGLAEQIFEMLPECNIYKGRRAKTHSVGSHCLQKVRPRSWFSGPIFVAHVFGQDRAKLDGIVREPRRPEWFARGLKKACEEVWDNRKECKNTTRPRIAMPRLIGCGLAGGCELEYFNIICRNAELFGGIDFELVCLEEEVELENLDLVRFEDQGLDRHRVDNQDKDWDVLNDLLSQLKPFATIQRTPLVRPPSKQGKLSDEKESFCKYFDEVMEYFSTEEGTVPDDDRFDQLINNTWEKLSDGEIISKIDHNLIIIRKIRGIINERQAEGTMIRPRLMKALARRISWPDRTEYLDCVCMAGDMRCRAYPIEMRFKMKNKYRRTRRQLVASIRRTNDKMLHRVSRGSSDHSAELRKQALDLAVKGKVEIHKTLDFIRTRRVYTHLLSPNFGVDQGKIRMCTDYSCTGSDLNSAANIGNRTVLHDHRFLDGMLRQFCPVFRRSLLWKADLKGAYRQLPLSPKERRLAAMLLDDLVIVPKTLGFGSRAAVHYFTQFSLLTTSLMICFIGLPVLVYIDDEFGILPNRGDARPSPPFRRYHDPSAFHSRLFTRVVEFHNIIGVEIYEIDGEKTVAPSETVTILGLDFSVDCAEYSVSVPEGRKEKIRKRISCGIEGSLDVERAGRLCGQLGFICHAYQSRGQPRIGGAYLRVIYDYHYGAIGIKQIRYALCWWWTMLDAIISRKMNIVPRSVCNQYEFALIFQDASDTHLGSLLAMGDRISEDIFVQDLGEMVRVNRAKWELVAASASLPSNSGLLVSEHCNGRETSASLFSMIVHGRRLRGRKSVILSDNTASVAIIGSGHARADQQRLSNIAIVAHLVAGCIGTYPWISYIKGEWQLADPISRPSERCKWWNKTLPDAGVMMYSKGIITLAIELMQELHRLSEPIQEDGALVRRFMTLASFGASGYELTYAKSKKSLGKRVSFGDVTVRHVSDELLDFRSPEYTQAYPTQRRTSEPLAAGFPSQQAAKCVRRYFRR
jgi:hypothetical protein